MARPLSPQIRVTALGSSAAAAVVWRFRGALRVTVIAKATFEMVPSGTMRPAAPEEVVKGEINHGNSPLRSVRVTSDLAPYIPAADVVLTGHAVPPGGQPVASLQARLVVFEGDTLLVDKRVIVRGDSKDGQPQPFSHMPLVYERAYGGIGFPDNPLGVGADTSQRKPPNLSSPDGPEVVACFAPISRVMPGRRRLLRSLDRNIFEKPIVEVPDDFDWGYFHVAPPDQRAAYLEGHEQIVLEGMSAQHPRLVSSLPAARASARVYGLSAEDMVPVPLVLDTLRIDADAPACTLVWRGSFTVPSEAALASLSVIAGVETAAQAIEWPAGPPEADTDPAAAAPETSPSGGAAERDFSRTSVFADTPHGPALPFQPGAARLPSRPSPAPPPPAPPRHAGTVQIAPPEEPPVTLPFQKVPAGEGAVPAAGGAVPATAQAGPATGAAAAAQAAFDEGEDVTFEIVSDRAVLAPSAATPFQKAPPPQQGPAAAPPSPSVPGAAPAPMAPPPAPARAKAPPPPDGPELAGDPRFAMMLLPWSLSSWTGPWGAPEPAAAKAGRDCLSFIAKATCDIVPDAPAEPRAAAEPLGRDRTAGTAKRPVCDYPSDLVPFKPRADVVLTGHAHAPGGSAPSCEVVFRFGGPGAKLERRILVFGDREWEKGKAGPRPSEPLPFSRMPLSHDRAFGGPGFEPNPVGKGYRPPLRIPADRSLANLEDPDRRLRLPTQKADPAAPGPILERWRARWALLGRQGPVFGALGDALDWTLFQAAPRAQQLPHLRGDEPFEIAGVHPTHATLKGSLPGLTARAEVSSTKGGPPTPLPLALDTVIIEADALALHLVFRGVLPVSSETDHGIAAIRLVVDKA